MANDATDITTAYTVDSGTIGDDAGGFITFTSPQTLNSLVTIVSGIPTDRTVDYQANGDFIPATVNNDIDRTVSLVKQNENLATRTIQFQESQQSASSITLPAPSAGDILLWNPTGTGFINDNGTGIAGINAAVISTAADAATATAAAATASTDATNASASAGAAAASEAAAEVDANVAANAAASIPTDFFGILSFVESDGTANSIQLIELSVGVYTLPFVKFDTTSSNIPILGL